MENEINMASKTKAVEAVAKKKKEVTWSKSTRVGEMTNEVRVEKLANGGFLVVYSKHGDDDKGKWISKEVKTYSETNPLDIEVETLDISSVFDELSRTK